MIWAFGRLLLIAAISSLCIIFVVFGLRLVGAKQTYSDFTHPLLDHGRWLIANGGDLDFGPEQSMTALRHAVEVNPHIFLGLKIRLTLDGHWVLYAPSRLEQLTSGNGFVLQKNLDEITSLKFKDSPDQSPLEISTVFKEFPNANYYIDVLQPGATQLKSLYRLIKEHHLEKKVILTSGFVDTLTNLRDEDAVWLTGASTAEYSKSQFMNSIFLETVMGLNFDVFVTDKNTPRLISELKRRKKIVVFKVDDRPELMSALATDSQIGILTKRPSYFTQKVDSHALSH
ncbi:MAG: hypothetical protein KDD38_02135 [Bdellovibrionales bacterium]|nr:hypothetical protein [Bdellovibrionales bacterium]